MVLARTVLTFALDRVQVCGSAAAVPSVLKLPCILPLPITEPAELSIQSVLTVYIPWQGHTCKLVPLSASQHGLCKARHSLS